MKTKIINQKDIDIAASSLINEEVIAFPTETVFGLGVVFDSLIAYQKLVNVKNRPPSQPFTLMCSNVNQISEYALVDKQVETIIKKFMPGPLTLILKVKDNVPTHVTLNTGYIGIRISSLEYVRNLISLVGKPLLVPSANRHGDLPATDDKEALKYFNGLIPLIVKGNSISNVASTIIKIDKEITLIREGSISLEQILSVVK